MRAFCWMCLLLAVMQSAMAHDARPISVELSVEQDLVTTRLKVPDALSVFEIPKLVMPAHCEPADVQQMALGFGTHKRQALYRCSDTLYGGEISLEFPGANPSLSTVIRAEMPAGEVFSAVLGPGTTEWLIPNEEEATTVALQYTWLGVEHIWLGIDHLLFVLCLLFIAKTPRRILITITGFTVAHSLTLILSTLSWVSLPIPVVEAIIALSIVFLALEILRENTQSWTFRYPVIVATSFGLLHGFGFASVLRDIGLPQTELPLALLMFNVGVEIGQVLFILGVWALARLFSIDRLESLPNARLMASYLVGTLASFWFIDRTLGFWV